MTTAAEYRQFAKECVESARSATSDDILTRWTTPRSPMARSQGEWTVAPATERPHDPSEPGKTQRHGPASARSRAISRCILGRQQGLGPASL